jgi:hypothetical protein
VTIATARRPNTLMKPILFTLFATAISFAQASDEAAVRVPLESYLKGHATGKAEYMRNIFKPEAHIEGLRDGKLVSWSVPEYVAGFKGEVSPEEPQRKRWIDKVEITGNAAIATLRFDYPKVKVTDYMLLLKIDGRWVIANKIFDAQPK